MSVDHAALLTDLKRRVKLLEDDLRERADEVPKMGEHLKAEYGHAREAERTAEMFTAWREATLTQAAVAWVLGCVFVRFLEDNELIDEPLIAGAGTRGERAAHHREEHFRAEPNDSDNDYLHAVFRTVAGLPGMAKLYDEAHNPLFTYGISGDAAKALIAFWRDVEEESGALIHDFADPEWNTRFLGDLYQDLSESARKRYALLQTPEFVEEFILERTLVPAIEEFGLEPTNDKGKKEPIRMIDPTCGSGHFLLGAFELLLARWMNKEPGTGERKPVQRALDGVYGVDINPFATAIARFRLVIAALKASVSMDDRDMPNLLKKAPDYRVNITTGDSLIHGEEPQTAADSLTAGGEKSGGLDLGGEVKRLRGLPGMAHVYDAEDPDELKRFLDQRYHVVVGNPPYITVKDKALDQLYRNRYDTCHRKYSVAVPFTERFFQLALPGRDGDLKAGYVGMITANSFMRREFGKKLIEKFLANIDLTHMIDTAGAYIPGHGTPTVILLGRNRSPVSSTVRTVLGIKGEPSTPEDPSSAKVWSAIMSQIDTPGIDSEWVSVADGAREMLSQHPWSTGGGGSADLVHLVEGDCSTTLSQSVKSIGFASFTGTDDAFVSDRGALSRKGVGIEIVKDFVYGEIVRDWKAEVLDVAIAPYDESFSPLPLDLDAGWGRHLWSFRTTVGSVKSFGGRTRLECGDDWWTWYRWVTHKYEVPFSITFAEVATHNHFVLDRGGKVFKQTAPVIKLSTDATEADHLALLGLLNSSTACFWIKQVFQNKGGSGIGRGIADEAWESRYQIAGTGLKKFPLPEHKPLNLATTLDRLATERQNRLPDHFSSALPLSRDELDTHRTEAESTLQRMVALQEELDWRCYTLYGVTDDDLTYASALQQTDGESADQVPSIRLGERAFEIVMARRMARDEFTTTWFERHGSTPVTELPDRWPDDYRALVERRIALIESDRNVGLVEQPEYKRRWNQEPWAKQEQRALRGWLLDRLETPLYWPDIAVQSTRALAERTQTDDDFRAVAELYAGRPDFAAEKLVADLVASESVPFLAALRYKPPGLRKRADWEKTWKRQREEDRIDAEVASTLSRKDRESDEEYANRLVTEQHTRRKQEVGDIPAPPKYAAGDFMSVDIKRLRGPLDVPKERFVSYPHGSPDDDTSLVVGWAGWDHRQQAIALIGHYTVLVEQHGWSAERLRPILAGLRELIPWIKQWHNDIDPEFDVRMGDYFAEYLGGELQKHGLTETDLDEWRPPARSARRKKAASKKAVAEQRSDTS